MASVMVRTEIAMRIIRPDAHRVMRWKNGFGTTTEIAIDPPAADVGGRFRWRLSIADVERSGPFSAFPGYERTIMVIAGNGMDLAIGDRPARRLDRLFESFAFSGDSAAECRLLDGPIRDFNLMVERSSLRAGLEVLQLDATPRSFDLASGDRIVHCFDGVIELALHAGALAETLQPNCTAILNSSTGVRGQFQLAAAADRRARAAIIELRPA
jgi:environmental stress-induced protein Ves